MKKLLLIVDDWERLERLEERLMPDYEVFCAPFGSEGLRLADEELPHVIVIDLSFEDMTVEEVHAKILERHHLKHVKIYDLPQGDKRLSLEEVVRLIKS
jgi:DNA-binding response OmpR family regulator